MNTRRRIDLLLVERGLFESRAKAQAAIAAGLVSADGNVVAKASIEVSTDATLQATPAHPYVSRGGVKLAAALEHGNIEVADKVCLDIGASTGGFSEVLALRGARRVYAVDVGHGQLHASLKDRTQIVSLEGTDIRNVTPEQLGERPQIIVIDASFISLKLVLPAAFALAANRCTLIALIKPQFELKRSALKKGVVREEALRGQVCDDIAAFIAGHGWRARPVFPSPITGGDGNVEFFVIAEHNEPLSSSPSAVMLPQ
jgi:23S rRNA (cytidine1920-2'-O)/16S rRNA (cytidine1409-2'-O)-methyltransferase